MSHQDPLIEEAARRVFTAELIPRHMMQLYAELFPQKKMLLLIADHTEQYEHILSDLKRLRNLANNIPAIIQKADAQRKELKVNTSEHSLEQRITIIDLINYFDEIFSHRQTLEGYTPQVIELFKERKADIFSDRKDAIIAELGKVRPRLDPKLSVLAEQPRRQSRRSEKKQAKTIVIELKPKHWPVQLKPVRFAGERQMSLFTREDYNPAKWPESTCFYLPYGRENEISPDDNTRNELISQLVLIDPILAHQYINTMNHSGTSYGEQHRMGVAYFADYTVNTAPIQRLTLTNEFTRKALCRPGTTEYITATDLTDKLSTPTPATKVVRKGVLYLKVSANDLSPGDALHIDTYGYTWFINRNMELSLPGKDGKTYIHLFNGQWKASPCELFQTIMDPLSSTEAIKAASRRFYHGLWVKKKIAGSKITSFERELSRTIQALASSDSDITTNTADLKHIFKKFMPAGSVPSDIYDHPYMDPRSALATLCSYDVFFDKANNDRMTRCAAKSPKGRPVRHPDNLLANGGGGGPRRLQETTATLR